MANWANLIFTSETEPISRHNLYILLTSKSTPEGFAVFVHLIIKWCFQQHKIFQVWFAELNTLTAPSFHSETRAELSSCDSYPFDHKCSCYTATPPVCLHWAEMLSSMNGFMMRLERLPTANPSRGIKTCWPQKGSLCQLSTMPVSAPLYGPLPGPLAPTVR